MWLVASGKDDTKTYPFSKRGQQAKVGGLGVTVLGGALDGQDLVLTVEGVSSAERGIQRSTTSRAGWTLLEPEREPKSAGRPTVPSASASPHARPRRWTGNDRAVLHADFTLSEAETVCPASPTCTSERRDTAAWLIATHLVPVTSRETERKRADLTCGVVTSSLFEGLSARGLLRRGRRRATARCGPHYQPARRCGSASSRPTSSLAASGSATPRSDRRASRSPSTARATGSSAPSRWTSCPASSRPTSGRTSRPGLDPAGHRAQPVPRRPLRRRAGRGQRRHRPAVAGRRRATASSARRSASRCRTAPAASSPASTSCATPTAPTACSRTTCATRAASPTCSRTAPR